MNRRASWLWLGFLLLTIRAVAAQTSPRLYVQVPAVGWEKIQPYLRAHIVPELRDGHLDVYVCSGRVDRTAVSPYDDELGDFTKAFLFEALLESAEIQRIASSLGDHLRERAKGMSEAESSKMGDLLWEEVTTSPLLKDLEARYTKARRVGRIRCQVCEGEPTFRPRGMVEGGKKKAASPVGK